MSDFFEINERILQLIKYLNVSNNKFANEIGISSARMSNIATKRNRPDSEMLNKIASTYPNVSMDWLISGSGSMNKRAIDSVKTMYDPYNEMKTCEGCLKKKKEIKALQNELIEAQKLIIDLMKKNV